MTQKIINFNHISETLKKEEIEKLKKWYYCYHRLATCYKWKFKTLKRKYLFLKLGSVSLVVIGGIAGGITANPIILGSISGPGVLIQTYLTTRSISKQIEMCRFAYTSYKHILTELRRYLQGIPYDEEIFLSDTKVLDDIVIDLCPHVDKLEEKYLKTYDISNRIP